MTTLIPSDSELPINGQTGRFAKSWRQWAVDVTRAINAGGSGSTELAAAVAAIATALGSPDGTVANIPDQESLDVVIVGRNGVTVTGKAGVSPVVVELPPMATSTIKARKTADDGAPEDCTLSEVLDFIGSAAQGDILYRGASAWARLGAGTSGQFLKTQGAGADPVWATPASGGAMTKLGTATVGGSAVTSLTINLTATPLSGYTYFKVVFNFKNATGTAGTLALYLNNDSTGTNYDRQTLSDIGSSVVGARTNANVLATLLANAVVQGSLEICRDRDGDATILFQASEGATTALQHRAGSIKYRTAADINYLTVTSSVANSLSPGDSFTVYGIA